MTILLLPSLLFHLLLLVSVSIPLSEAGGGQWQLLQKSIGIVAMHMQLLHNDRVIIFDRTDFGLSNLTLPNGTCRHDPFEKVVKTDCTAHSVEYDVASNTFRALFVQTDVWCSSGAVAADGTLVQSGGFGDGERNVRLFFPCPTCDWKEFSNRLMAKRWYSTNHLLPDGGMIIIGGRMQFNYEFYPKTKPENSKLYLLPFLVQTYDKGAENNLYPFVILNVDGNLFVFANNCGILFNYQNNTVVRTYPMIPGGDPRSYPSTGSAVLLPLRNLERPNLEAEVLICGGARRGAFDLVAKKGIFSEALDTCARIQITDPNATWLMESMASGRVMNDMLILPNGDVLLINGARSGVAGWHNAMNPVLEPLIYKPNCPVGSRFELQNASTIPRMYHSTAVLLRDGRVLVGGSNPNKGYEFINVSYPTELSLEAFSPNYLDPRFTSLRPIILDPSSPTHFTYGHKFNIRIQVNGHLVPEFVSVTMLAPPFNTHSVSMNQRLLVLSMGKLNAIGNFTYEFEVTAPGSSIIAPPTFYMLFVIHQEIPSAGIWIRMQ